MGKVETHANGKDILVHPLRLEDVIEEMDRLTVAAMADAGRTPGTSGRVHATESGFRFSIVPLEEVL